jgi:co-chaperonin GroES (HSP10)
MIQALGKNVIAKPVYEEKKTIILTTAHKHPDYYVVLSVGDQVTIIKADDIIYAHQYGHEVIEIDGEFANVINIDNVYGVKI